MSLIKTKIQVTANRTIGAYRLMCLMNPLSSIKGLMRAKKSSPIRRKSGDHHVVLLCDMPNHGNIGDQAIALAEEKYLKDIGIDELFEVDQIGGIEELVYYKHVLPCDITVILHGGGNMGSLYKGFEFLRAADIQAFPHANIICMPQTADYANAEGRLLANYMRSVYSSAHKVMMLARDERSYYSMRALFPSVEVRLTPDIVMTYKTPFAVTTAHKRNGALIAFRNDSESTLHPNTRDIEEHLSEVGIDDVKLTDTSLRTGGKLNVRAADRESFVFSKLNEFSGARIVITDRLHGMVMSAITNTPCVAFNNKNKKVQALYETWLKDCPFVEFVDSNDNWRDSIKRVLDAKMVPYNFEKFNDFFNDVKEYLLSE